MKTMTINLPNLASPRSMTMAALLAYLALELLSSRAGHAYQTPPDVIHVPGIVRDFQRSHADFNIVPSAGYGHYAGNIAENIGANYRPILDADGFKVALQWRNALNRPIAPHLFVGLNPIQIANSPITAAGTTIDSYDPDAGAYGGTNVGPAPNIIVGSEMPIITLPTDLGPSVGNYQLTNDPETISTSFLCDTFSTKDSAIMLVDGDVTIHCLGNFTMQQSSSIELLPGATLRIYVGEAFKTFQGSSLNLNTLDPRRCYIFNYGDKLNDISQFSGVCATIISPNASLELGQDVQFFGTFIGSSIDMRQGSGFHSGGAQAQDSCGAQIEDLSGAPGSFSTGGITSPSSFNQWFSDVLGTNLSMIHRIAMVRDPVTGIYEFATNAFYPIDNRLYGNENDAHNFYFTYSFQASLTYEQCTNQFLEFSGDDDVWVFINNKLAIDLGGVLPGVTQIIELDRLGLTDGETYGMHFFYAQRQPFQAGFNLRTNIVITPPAVIATGTGSYD